MLIFLLDQCGFHVTPTLPTLENSIDAPKLTVSDSLIFRIPLGPAP